MASSDTPRPTRRQVAIGAAAVAGVTAICWRALTRPGRPPNVLVILADQLRHHALGFTGDRNVATPAIDALLGRSVWFQSAFATNPLCSPSRASLLTGLYPRAAGVPSNDMALREGVPTLGTVMRGTGRHTGYLGKWHLSGARTAFVPTHRRFGFEAPWTTSGAKGSRGGLLFSDRPRAENLSRDNWLPAVLTDRAVEAMRGWGDQPWCLMVSYDPPHPPGAGVSRWREDLLPSDLAAIDPAALAFRGNVPADVLAPDPAAPSADRRMGARGYLHCYYAAIRSLDREVGRLLAGLDDAGQRDDTVVVFASDHGDLAGSHGRYMKQKPYDESIRVPLAIAWPGRLAPARVEAPVTLADLLPTLAGLVGAPMPPVDGRDLSGPLLAGDPVQGGPVAIGSHLRSRDKRWWTWRGRRWAYTVYDGSGQTQLFDMASDPLQLTDLSGRPEVADREAELRSALHARRGQLGEADE
ncbi:MAG: arylsulfatase A-like enzyme [Myxococcota bacterium]